MTELTGLLNQALELEHSARIQYLSHAELIKGFVSESLISRLKEIASDEAKHEGIFRNLIGNYLGGTPSMSLNDVHEAKTITTILAVNLKGEKDAIVFYKEIYQKVLELKETLQYTFETLEHEIRHVIIDEQEHVAELSNLLE